MGPTKSQVIPWRGGHTHVKAEVVIEKCLARIDHPDIVQLILIHRLKNGYLHLDSAEVQLSGLVWVHSVELHDVSISRMSCKG